jgi:hypothetical protein
MSNRFDYEIVYDYKSLRQQANRDRIASQSAHPPRSAIILFSPRDMVEIANQFQKPISEP